MSWLIAHYITDVVEHCQLSCRSELFATRVRWRRCCRLRRKVFICAMPASRRAAVSGVTHLTQLRRALLAFRPHLR